MKSKGFTLIELLVVVAIIGILATVVLASLGSARAKAKDAAVKAGLMSFRNQAELRYLTDGNYNNICNFNPNSETLNLFIDTLSKNGSANNSASVCIDTNSEYFATVSAPTAGSNYGNSVGPDAWLATISLSDGTWFCVDSEGFSEVVSGRRNDNVNNNCAL